MAKNKKTVLIVLGLGVVGFGLYEYMKKRGGTIPVDTIAPGDDQTALPPPVNQLPPPTNFVPGGRVETDPVVIRDDVNQNPVGRNIDSSLRPQSIPAPVTVNTAVPAGADNTPITEQVKQVVMAWVDADGRPPIEAIGTARIPAEFNGMYDIIQGGWRPTPDQRVFWNNLIAKYDPNHNYL